LIPARFFSNRTRVTANSLNVLFAAAFLSYFFLLTLFEQQVLHLSPLQGGLGYVPFGLGIGAGMGIGTVLMPKVGVKARSMTSRSCRSTGALVKPSRLPRRGVGSQSALMLAALCSRERSPRAPETGLLREGRSDRSMAGMYKTVR
jgi:hypothetical protein